MKWLAIVMLSVLLAHSPSNAQSSAPARRGSARPAARPSASPASRPTPRPMEKAQGERRSMDRASTPRSDYFFQPEAGSQSAQVTGTYGFTNTDVNFGIATGQAKNTTLSLSLQYLFGLNENFAFGIERLAYSSSSTEVTTSIAGLASQPTKSSGLNDIEIGARGIFPLPLVRLFVGGRVGVSPMKAKGSSSTVEGNQTTGGLSLRPYVGADAPVGPGSLGVDVSYAYPLERDVEASGGGSSKVSGGSTLTATLFYELHVGEAFVMPAIGYMSNSASTTTTNGVSTTGTSSDNVIYGVQAGYHLSPDLTVGAGYAGARVPEQTSGTTKISASYVHGLVAIARIVF